MSRKQDGVTANQRILVIDDSPLVVEAISDGLEEDGVVVEGVTDLTELDQSQGLERFSLILIDVQMPAMFCDDVAMVIRQREGCQEAPIVLLSSLADAELAVRAKEAGADGYISKRRGVDGILAEIRAWLASGRRHAKEA